MSDRSGDTVIQVVAQRWNLSVPIRLPDPRGTNRKHGLIHVSSLLRERKMDVKKVVKHVAGRMGVLARLALVLLSKHTVS